VRVRAETEAASPLRHEMLPVDLASCVELLRPCMRRY
jgi:hypothetical protein